MPYLNFGCVHTRIVNYLRHPMLSAKFPSDDCNAFPTCNAEFNEIFLPVDCYYIKKFLCEDIFIAKGSMTCKDVISELWQDEEL